MGTKDPENVGELILLILGLTPQDMDKIFASTEMETELRDIEGVPEQVICTKLGEITVKTFLKIVVRVPIYYPNTPIADYIQKSFVKGAITGAIAGMSSVAAKTFVKRCQKQALQEIAVKKALQEVAEEGAKKALQEVAEEGAKKALQEVAEESVKKAAKEAAEEAAKKGATQCAFVFGAAVEVVSFGASCYCANEKLKRHQITQTEFNRHVVKRGGGAVASFAGSTIGATVGTAVIPIPFVGTFVGSVVGAVVGDGVGSFIGGQLYDNA